MICFNTKQLLVVKDTKQNLKKRQLLCLSWALTLNLCGGRVQHLWDLSVTDCAIGTVPKKGCLIDIDKVNVQVHR